MSVGSVLENPEGLTTEARRHGESVEGATREKSKENGQAGKRRRKAEGRESGRREGGGKVGRGGRGGEGKSKKEKGKKASGWVGECWAAVT